MSNPIQFYSTRDPQKNLVTGSYAIVKGIAPDGGLYFPNAIPELSKTDLVELQGMDYSHRAAKILSLYLNDFSFEELLEDATAAYSQEHFGESPAPVVSLHGNTYILELFHGPTCAFKDMALQIMPRLLVRSLHHLNEERLAYILVATSGDTGKAALEGFRDVKRTAIQVFYPTDGVSTVQKLQMQTQQGENVQVTGIYGNFDDAQSAVKSIFTNPQMQEAFNQKGILLSSANSINFGRLVPQVIYYISAYLELVNKGVIQLGDLIDFSVPTGNFGNIFAAFLAKQMGLPIRHLICASNANNVLTEFLTTGTYNRNRPFHKTISPSMDILISSNLERLLGLNFGAERTRVFMNELQTSGMYSISSDELSLLQETFLATTCDDTQTKEVIQEAFSRDGYLLDPHTACAVYGADQCSDLQVPMVIVSTASPHKFAKDVLESLGCYSSCDELEIPSVLYSVTGIEVPSPIQELSSKEVRFQSIQKKEDIPFAVKAFLGVS